MGKALADLHDIEHQKGLGSQVELVLEVTQVRSVCSHDDLSISGKGLGEEKKNLSQCWADTENYCGPIICVALK